MLRVKQAPSATRNASGSCSRHATATEMVLSTGEPESNLHINYCLAILQIEGPAEHGTTEKFHKVEQRFVSNAFKRERVVFEICTYIRVIHSYVNEMITVTMREIPGQSETIRWQTRKSREKSRARARAFLIISPIN